MQVTYPRPLEAGDTVALVCPASTPQPERVARAIARLEAMDLRVKTYRDLFREHGYLAGDDDLRVEELMAALADPEVAAVLPARGGYGMTRVVHRIDYNLLRDRPKIVAGFSDITALHLAIQAEVGLVTFHSPHPQDGFGQIEEPHPLTLESYRRALWSPSLAEGYELLPADNQYTRCLAAGTATGRITGGNVALVAALVGTPYEVQTEGRILFLEDIGEEPYRIDRYLSQLRLAGKLDNLAGVLLGQFTDCQPNEGKPSLTLEQVFDDYLTGLDVPVLAGFPAGHDSPNLTLPMGATVELDADQGRVLVQG